MLSLTLKGRYTPYSTLAEDRVISLLYNVVIDTQRQIYPSPHSTLSEDRVISSLFNVVIDTQRKIYPLFNSSRGQSDLFTVQCCHWHSKADIPPTFNTIRGQSDLFTVQCCHWPSKADIASVQHYQRTDWSLHCSMLSLTLKGRYNPTQSPPSQI